MRFRSTVSTVCAACQRVRLCISRRKRVGFNKIAPHDRDRATGGSPGQDRPPSETRRGEPALPVTPRRLGAVSGRRHCRHHRLGSSIRYPRSPSSAAKRGSGSTPMPRGAARRSSRLHQDPSRWHRALGLDHLRRAPVAFRAHGLRHVLLPSPAERGPQRFTLT